MVRERENEGSMNESDARFEACESLTTATFKMIENETEEGRHFRTRGIDVTCRESLVKVKVTGKTLSGRKAMLFDLSAEWHIRGPKI